MSQRYSGKSRKDSSTMKKAKLSIKEKRKNIMKNQSTKKLEKDLLKLHTKYFTDTDKLTILHLVLDGKIADAKDYVETSRRTWKRGGQYYSRIQKK